MSTTYYTVNPFSPNKDIVDVSRVEPFANFAPMGLAIRIPDGVAIRGNPMTLAELLAEKSAGILRGYDGFSGIVLDPCLTTVSNPYPGVNIGASNKYIAGSGDSSLPGLGNTNHQLLPSGVLTFQNVTLPGAVDTCVLLWEVYETFVGEDPESGLIRRLYIEQPSSHLPCEVSFNGGASYTVANASVLTNVAPADQGTNLVVRFSNPVGIPLYLGSWALVY